MSPMNSRMVIAVFPFALLLAWAPRGHSDLAPHHGLDAGAVLLRREPDETEFSTIADGKAVTAEVRFENLKSDILPSSSEHALPTSSKRMSSNSERMRTSFSERDELDNLKQETRASQMEAAQLLSRMKSELWRTPQTKPHHSHTGSKISKYTVHNCKNDQSCVFSGCGDASGYHHKCLNGNCYAVETAATNCNGVADGTDVSGSAELFCSAGKPTKVCPPKACKDKLEALGGTSCSTLKTEDAGFCSNASLKVMIGIFCRYSCGLCKRATCAHATGAASCPAPQSVAKSDKSTECSDTSCDVSSPQSNDFSKCCTPICDGSFANNSFCVNSTNMGCKAATECCPVGFTCKLPPDKQIEACVDNTNEDNTVNSVPCAPSKNDELSYGGFGLLIACISVVVGVSLCGVLYNCIASIFVLVSGMIWQWYVLRNQKQEDIFGPQDKRPSNRTAESDREYEKWKRTPFSEKVFPGDKWGEIVSSTAKPNAA